MSHVTDDGLLDLLEGRGTSEDQHHVARCPSCSAALGRWRSLEADAALLASSALHEEELHRLQVMFRAFGPVRESCSEWIGRLVRSALPVPLPVRGGGPVPQEHEAGPFSVALQLRLPADGGGMAVHGQVYSDEQEVGDGEVVLSDGEDTVVTGDIDELGEFSVRVPAGRSYRVALLLPSARIRIDNLQVAGGKTLTCR